MPQSLQPELESIPKKEIGRKIPLRIPLFGIIGALLLPFGYWVFSHQYSHSPIVPKPSTPTQPTTPVPGSLVKPSAPPVFILPKTVQHLSPSVKTHHRNGTLTVVAVGSPAILFQKDKFKHGFYYDLARNYAERQDMNFKFISVKNNAAALRALASGKAQLALTTTQPQQLTGEMTAIDQSCDQQSSFNAAIFGKPISWVFKSADDPLAIAATQYFCDSQKSEQIANLAHFYDQGYLNDSVQTIDTNIKQRLPLYKTYFQQSAKLFSLDWQFLVAVAYQESYLNPTSVSPTGVRGLMMLTSDTATEMGIYDRENPQQSIFGGTKFLYQMLQKYRTAAYPDRYWLSLVAYNMGPGALDQVRSQVKNSGQNPNSWLEVQSYLIQHQAENSRYVQTLQYVKRIRAYLEHIKTHKELAKI